MIPKYLLFMCLFLYLTWTPTTNANVSCNEVCVIDVDLICACDGSHCELFAGICLLQQANFCKGRMLARSVTADEAEGTCDIICPLPFAPIPVCGYCRKSKIITFTSLCFLERENTCFNSNCIAVANCSCNANVQ